MFAVGNILNRAQLYFQDFGKCFSIFNKAKQLQLNRKIETNQKREREGSPPGSAQPTGLASRRPPPARRKRSAWPMMGLCT